MKRAALGLAAILGFVAAALAAEVTLDVREHVLPNGMKILMIPRPGVPRVVCHVYFKVGSINERPGITGIAHLHEHMMFKGTKMMGVTDFAADEAIDRQIDGLMNKIYHEKFWKAEGGDKEELAQWQKQVDELVKSEKPYIVKDELWELYMKNGGTGLNASTSNETTGYYVTLPSNKVELQMLLESDRLMNAYFREFYSEKDVVMEERRLSENRPGFLFDEQVSAAFYTASPYHWEVLGWMDDLRKITKQDMIAFHNTYYVPNNAVAIYVGDFNPENIIALAEKYFGRIPKGPDLEPIRTSEPPQDCEKRIYGEGPGATRFQRRGGGGGGTGRLNKILVEEKQLAVNASAFSRPQWYVGSFQINATPRVDKKVQPEDLEKEIWAIVDDIKKNGVTGNEIQMAKNRRESTFLRSLQSPMGLASSVGRAELNRGWRAMLTDIQDIKKVTNDDIKRVAAKYFVKDNSLAAIYHRQTWE
jgi:predicted Zn-dependent peptidase